jgi:DNA polymerase V
VNLPELPLEQPVSGTCIEAEPYALQVLDETMAPEFPAGCIIIVDPTGHARAGAHVVADVDGEVLFRTLEFDEVLGPVLVAGDRSLGMLPITGDLTAIKGVVTQRAGRRRKDHRFYD